MFVLLRVFFFRQLASSNNNLRFAGICGLSTLVKLDASYAIEHQMTVVSCLEDVDLTIQRKTLDLLYRMTNSKNVTTIVDCFITHLKSNMDSHASIDLISKITLLSEKYAPGLSWYMDTSIQIMMIATDLVDTQILYNLINVIKDQFLNASEDLLRYSTVLQCIQH